MAHVQVQLGYGTAAQIAAYTGVAREPIWDTTNLRIVVMTGAGAGLSVPLASESYVQAQVAALSAGTSSNLVFWQHFK